MLSLRKVSCTASTLPESPLHATCDRSVLSSTASETSEFYIGDESGGVATPTATPTKSVKVRDAIPQEMEAATLNIQPHMRAYLLRKRVRKEKESIERFVKTAWRVIACCQGDRTWFGKEF